MTDIDAQIRFLSLLPTSQRRQALAAMHPNLASILDALAHNPAAIRRCPADRLSLLFVSCDDMQLLSTAVAADKRKVTAALWEELCHSSYGSYQKAGASATFDTLIACVSFADPSWWIGVLRSIEAMEEAEAAAAARQVFALLPGVFYAPHVMYEYAASVAAFAIPAGTTCLPPELLNIDTDVAVCLLKQVALPHPAVLAPIVEQVGSHHGIGSCLLGPELELTSTSIGSHLRQAGNEWWQLAGQVSSKDMPCWELVVGVFTGKKLSAQALSALADESGEGAWALAVLCQDPENRQLFARAALNEGVCADDRNVGSLWEQMVGELVVSDPDKLRASAAAYQLLAELESRALYSGISVTSRNTAHLEELVRLSALERPVDALGFALRFGTTSVLPHCPNLAPLVFSNFDAADVFAPLFAERLADADQDVWHMVYQLSTEWAGTVEELLDTVLAIRT